MKIKTLGCNKFMAELSIDDMSEMDITYENMDYSNEHTKQVINSILDEVKILLGKDIDPTENMLIEATPKIDGGCILLFTIATQKKKSLPVLKSGNTYGKGYLVYEFININHLLDLIPYIGKKNLPAYSTVFEKNNRYRIVFKEFVPRNIRHKTEEFGFLAGKGKIFAAKTEEYWHKIGLID